MFGGPHRRTGGVGVDRLGVEYSAFFLECQYAQDGLVDPLLGESSLVHGSSDRGDGLVGVGGHEQLVHARFQGAHRDFPVGVCLTHALHVQGVRGDHTVVTQFLTEDLVDERRRQGGRIAVLVVVQLRHEHVCGHDRVHPGLDRLTEGW